MTARDDAIKVAWLAIPDSHDFEDMELAARIVDVVSPIIRADERKRHAREMAGASRSADELLDRFYLEMLGEVSYDAVVEFARAIEDRARADARGGESDE